MRVIATAVGYHGKIRQAGEQFDVADGEKGSWFVPDPTAKAKADADAKAKADADAKAKADADAKAKADADAKAADKPAGKQGAKGDDLV